MMVITRIRNIAEHAVVPDSADPLRNTRTTHANFLERLFIAPYYVNYHLEHHLLFYVPCYNLPRVHRILSAEPARRPHGGAAELRGRAAAGDREAEPRGSSGAVGEQRAPRAGRRRGRRRPGGRRLLGTVG